MTPPKSKASSSSPDGLQPRRLVIGISGATGAIYGIRLLQVLKTTPEIETHLVLSNAAERTITFETEFTIREIRELADVAYNVKDIGATISSGSFKAEGMIVAPCSMKTLSAVAH